MLVDKDSSATDSLSLEWGPAMCDHFNKLPCVVLKGSSETTLTNPLSVLEGGGNGLSAQESGTSGLSLPSHFRLSTCYVPYSSDVVMSKTHPPALWEHGLS